MRILRSLFFLAALAIFCGPLPAQTSALASSPVIRSANGEKLKLPGLPNGGKISESVFRGAQPRAEGFQQLKNLGITTIVDLRAENKNKMAWERKQAESLGIRFVSIPVNGWAPPTDEQVAQFLSLFRNHSSEKVFVHCRFGEDRTGVFVAAYRIALEGWPAQQATNEMDYFGFHGFWHPSMKSYIRNFPARLNSAPALSDFRPEHAATN